MLILFFLLFFPLVSQNSFAELSITEWNQINTVRDKEQEIFVKIKLKAEMLPEGYYHSSWSYLFDKNSKINLNYALVNNDQKTKGEFNKIENKLEFEFDKLLNDDEVEITFSYNTPNHSNKFYSDNIIQIPNFAADADGNIVIKFPDKYEVFSSNDIFYKNNFEKVYSWKGVVPKNGIFDIISLTPKKAKWKAITMVELEDSNNIGTLSFVAPLYFYGGGNSVVEYNVSSSQFSKIDYKNIRIDDNFAYADFKNFQEKKAFIKIEAVLENKSNDFHWINKFDNNKLLLKKEYILPLNNIINSIKQNNKKDPLHIKIAKWVNEYIIYDENFIGKNNITSLELLELKRGVCIHYAILYRDLLRAAGIPAFEVAGLAYSEKMSNGFEGHAWVMVSYNDKWIAIDPTWGIYSGKLPISHIFMYKDTKTSFNAKKIGKINSLTIKIGNNAEIISLEN